MRSLVYEAFQSLGPWSPGVGIVETERLIQVMKKHALEPDLTFIKKTALAFIICVCMYILIRSVSVATKWHCHVTVPDMSNNFFFFSEKLTL